MNCVKTLFLRTFFCLLCLAAFTGSAAWCGEFSLGAVGVVSTSPYKSYDTVVSALPLVNYDSDRFYVKGVELGAHLLKNDMHTVSVGVLYHGMEFDPKDTKDKALKLLGKRRSTLMAAVSYSFTSRFGVLQAQISQDIILGRSKGTLGDFSYQIPWVTEKITVMPGIGITLSSEKYTKYYFGVSRSESARSGIPYYKPSGISASPYLSLGMKYMITDRLSAVASGKVELLTGKVKDSPMVGRSCVVSFAAGMQFAF